MSLNKEGDALLERGDFVKALAVFQSMLDLCGDHQLCRGVALFYQGRALLEAARYLEAEDRLNQAEPIFAALNRKNESAMVAAAMGKVMAGRGDYRGALKRFRQAEQTFSELKNQKELALLYTSMSVALAYMAEYDDAFQCLHKAEQSLGDSPSPAQRAPILTNRGLVAFNRRDYDDALQHYGEALKIYEDAGNLKAAAVVLNNIGQVHEGRSQYAKALESQTKALESARTIQDQWMEALALNNIGCVELKRGNIRAAEEAYAQSLKIRESLGIKHFAAETLNNMGLVRLAGADYAAALQCFKDSSETCAALGTKTGEAWALHNTAFVFKDQGKFRESLAASEKAVEIGETCGDRRLEATAVLRLGNLYEYQGLFDKAMENYVRAANIQQEIRDLNFKANTLSDIAGMLIRRGNMAEAEQYYTAAVKIRNDIGSPAGEVLCKLALAYLEGERYFSEVTGARGDSETHRGESLRKAKECIDKARGEIKPDHKQDLLLLTYVKGRYLLDTDPTQAVQEFRGLKSMADAARNRRFMFLSATGIGLALEKAGKLQEAETAYRQAVEYAEGIRNTLDPQARVTFLDGEEILGVKHSNPYEGLSRVLMRRNKVGESLTSSEYTKARSFSEALSRRCDNVSFNIPREVAERDQDIEDRMAALLRNLDTAYEQGSAEVVSLLEKEIADLSMQRDKHRADLRDKHPLYAVTKYPDPMPLSQVRLGTDEWVLVYDVTDHGLLVFLLKGPHVVKGIYKPISRKEIDALVRRFREPLDIVPGRDDPAAKLKAFDFAAGHQLAELLLGGILRDLPQGKPVIVVPDDSLGVLPFEMLTLNREGKVEHDEGIPVVKGAEFFGTRNPISYYQSITALTLARTLGTDGKPNDRILVMADPVFQMLDARAEPVKTIMVAQGEKDFSLTLMSAMEESSGGTFHLNRLVQTGELAETLEEVFQDRSDIYTGLRANKQAVVSGKAPDLRQYGNIVFGTHGFFSNDNPHFMEPVLVLTLVPTGTDGFLRTSEVLGLNLSCDTVALTACQTGLGKQISGEGTLGMGRAFQYAGARSVLMSLWSVSEKASVILVESFFKNIKEGKSKLVALQLAREEVRSEGFDHPFFWSAFVLSGEVN
jgi:tetratricopeptide (TPR) repeat protein